MSIIDMTQPNGRKSTITIGVNADEAVEIWLMREGVGNIAVVLPPLIALRVATELVDAARSTQKVPTPKQQIEQGKRCPCHGSDDMCTCQNVVPIR